MFVNFNKINVETMETQSGIFIGENYAAGWTSISKNQELVGSVVGHFNHFSHSYGVIIDEDTIDSPTVSLSSYDGDFRSHHEKLQQYYSRKNSHRGITVRKSQTSRNK